MGKRLALTAALIGVTALWGGTFVLIQEAVVEFSVFSFLMLRYALAAVAVLPFTLRRIPSGYGRSELWAGGLLGLAVTMGILLQTTGLRTTTSTNAGLITGLYVVFAPLLAMALFRARVERRVWLAVALSVVGLVLVAGSRPGELCLGDSLVLAAAVAWGLQIALLSRVSPGRDTSALTLLQLAVPALLFLPVSLWLGAGLWPRAPVVWWGVIVTGLGCSALGYWVQTYAQARIPAGRAAVILATEPVFAALTGYLWAGDRLSGVQWLGAALMMLALAVAELGTYFGVYSRQRTIHRALPTGEEA